MTMPTAVLSGTFLLGGDLPVHRLGFGAMRITGDGVWGPPRDRAEAIATLQRAIELGINLIDTAESYGPHVSEELIAEALYPYPKGLVIATKGGYDRSGPHEWEENGRPERLRAELDGSLRRLRLDRLDLYQLHRIDPKVSEEDQFGFLQEAQRAGKIRHIGLSEVSVEQIQRARRHFAVVQTHALQHDRDWLRALLAQPLAYLGLLGPRPRKDEILRQLGAAEPDKLFAPVGLDLGADGPEQVAVSIVAEMLAVNAGRQPGHLRAKPGGIHEG